MEIVAPTWLEYWAVRHTLPHLRARWAGVRLARWQEVYQESSVIVCGLAGALVPGLPSGTVLVPEQIGLEDGKLVQCDPTLVHRLMAAVRALHLPVDTRPLVTAHAMIVGAERHVWAQRGFVAADMETGLLAAHNPHVATIRVVLDSPERGISAEWLRPTQALLKPALWRELFWLSHAAPRYALRAARVLKLAMEAEMASVPDQVGC